MATDDAPLPQGANEQNGREDDVHQLVRNQDNADGNYQEAHKHQGGIDAEGTLNLVALHTQQQRDENHAQQPRILHQQVGGHNDEVLVNHHQRHTQDEGKGDRRRCHDDTSALLHKLLGTQPLGNHETDDGEVQQGSYHRVEDGREQEAENPPAVPLRIGVGLVFLLDGTRHGAPIALPVLEDAEVTVAAILEDICLDIVVTLLGIVVQTS